MDTRRKAKEINDLRKSLPKEYKKDIDKLISYFYIQGVNDAKGLMSEVLDVPSNLITNYCVIHEDEIDEDEIDGG